MSKRDRSLYYQADRAARMAPVGKVCLCGRPAFRWSNGYVCQRCFDMESNLTTPKVSGCGSDYGDAVYAVSGDINTMNYGNL
jgi:hypothetical protein